MNKPKADVRGVLSGSCNLTWTYSTKLDNQEEAQRDPRLAGKEAAYQGPEAGKERGSASEGPEAGRKRGSVSGTRGCQGKRQRIRDPRLAGKEAAYQRDPRLPEKGKVFCASRECQGLSCLVHAGTGGK